VPTARASGTRALCSRSCERTASRDDEGEWRTLEAYLEEMSHSRVTHGMCPDCERRMMEEKGGLNSA
jgi:hypothetical protein